MSDHFATHANSTEDDPVTPIGSAQNRKGKKIMKNVQAFAQKIRARATTPWRRRVGPLVLCLVIGLLLVACGGGSTPPDQSTNPPTESEDSAAALNESEDSPAASDESEDSDTDEDEDSATAPDESEDSDTDEEDEEGQPGSEEFGMTKEELVKSIEDVEALIAICMREAGFEYLPVDYLTARQAMTADKSAPGLSDEEYAASFGYGITTQLLEAAEVHRSSPILTPWSG